MSSGVPSRFSAMCSMSWRWPSVPYDSQIGKPLPGDPASVGRGEEQHAVGDVFRSAEPFQRDVLNELALAFGPVRLPLLLGRRVRAHEARRDVVDRNSPRTELVRELPREPDLRRLGGRVRLDARETDAAPGAARDVDDAARARRLY